MSIASLITDLIAAGTPAELVGRVAAALAEREVVTVQVKDEAAERRRAADRERKANIRRIPQTSEDNENGSCEPSLLEEKVSSYQKEPPKGGFQKGKVSDADLSAGAEAVEAIRGLRGIPDHAFTAHQSVMAALDQAGFVVAKEVHVESPDELGRLDVVATKDGGQVAIEIDSRSPRKKSLRKLNRMDCFRIVALRRLVPVSEQYDGIHAVVGIDTANGTAWARGSRITEDWRPSEANVAYAKRLGLTAEQIEKEVTKFVRYWLAAPGQKAVKVNWSATWENWIDRAAEYLGAKPQVQATAPETTITTREEWFELLQKRAAQ